MKTTAEFNHNSSSMYEAMGISKERNEEMNLEIKRVFELELDKKSKEFEKLIKFAKSPEEVSVLVFRLMSVYTEQRLDTLGRMMLESAVRDHKSLKLK